MLDHIQSSELLHQLGFMPIVDSGCPKRTGCQDLSTKIPRCVGWSGLHDTDRAISIANFVLARRDNTPAAQPQPGNEESPRQKVHPQHLKHVSPPTLFLLILSARHPTSGTPGHINAVGGKVAPPHRSQMHVPPPPLPKSHCWHHLRLSFFDLFGICSAHSVKHCLICLKHFETLLKPKPCLVKGIMKALHAARKAKVCLSRGDTRSLVELKGLGPEPPPSPVS